ncbi:MAG: prolipoprotein diacylglyceryl transferase family protein, partial [Chitinophagales bacterium]
YSAYYTYEFGGIDKVPSAYLKAPSFLPRWTVAQNFSHNVNEDGIPIQNCTGNWCYMLPAAVFPTALYETVMSIFIFLLLLFLRSRWKIPGLVFAFYILMTGVERFFIEKIRVNNVLEFMGIHATQAEFISVGFILFGLAFMFYLLRNHKLKTA